MLYVKRELISKFKRAVCKLEDEGEIFAAEVLCFRVVFPSSLDGFIDSFEVSSLTNCIFKFRSNTTLKAGAASLYSLNLRRTFGKVLVPRYFSIQRLK